MDHPTKLTADVLQELFDNSSLSGPAITIYLPTHRASTPPHMNEDQIRSKNLIRKAMDILKTRDDGEDMSGVVTDLLEALLHDRNFWERLSQGLLICIRPGSTRLLLLPIDTEEYVAVADHFHLAPVFGLVGEMQDYYVLTVNQNIPVLLKGDFYELVPSEVALPESLEAGLRLDEVNAKSEQQRSTGGATGGYNGRGGSKDPGEETRLRFWRLLDQTITAKADTHLPLLLGGTESELSEYRSISRYPQLMDRALVGSYGGVAPHDMYAPAVDTVRTERSRTVQQAVVGEYQRAKGQAPETAAHTLAAIQAAAEEGRVDKLLLAGFRTTTDTVQDKAESLPMLCFPPEGVAQTINDIASKVWQDGGTIINLDEATMPEPSALLLATLRY